MLKPVIKTANSLRSDSAVFITNAKFCHLRSSSSPCKCALDGSAPGQVLPWRASPSFPHFIHTVRHTRTNTSSIFMLSTRYVVTVINIIHNLWITLWITFLFAVYNLWVFPIFPVFTPCIMCISVFQTLHILFFSASYPQSYQHSISCYPQIILLCINRKIFYTFCG